MALKSGLDMDESLSLSEKLTDYEPLKMKIQQCQEQMKEGETFPKALKEAHIFDGMQERLMIIGYETGAVDEVMEQAADLYQKQLQDQIQNDRCVRTDAGRNLMCDRRDHFIICHVATSWYYGWNWIREADFEKSFSKTKKN